MRCWTAVHGSELSSCVRTGDLLSNWLPGGLPGSSGYLGREVFMAVSGRASNERRKHRYRADVSVCSGYSSAIGDRRSGTKPWTC